MLIQYITLFTYSFVTFIQRPITLNSDKRIPGIFFSRWKLFISPILRTKWVSIYFRYLLTYKNMLKLKLVVNFETLEVTKLRLMGYLCL